MDYTPLIEKRRQRLEELETVIAEPDFFNDQKKASEIMREHRRLKELMETWVPFSVWKNIFKKFFKIRFTKCFLVSLYMERLNRT